MSNSSEILNYEDSNFEMIFSLVWRRRYSILLSTLFFALISLSVAITAPNIYKSEALLSPAEPEQQSGLSVLSQQLGGLSSIAGFSMGASSGIDRTTLAIEVLKSRAFLSRFIENEGILYYLFAVEDWNESDKQLVLKSEFKEMSKPLWIERFKNDFSRQEGISQFQELLNVEKNNKTGLIDISVEYYSPIIAKEWVDKLIVDINKEMRARDLDEASRSIEYLKKQLVLTDITEMRNALYQLIEEQSKVKMFAEIRDEYVFKTVDPAIIPEKRLSPKKALICIFGTALGFLLSVVMVLIYHLICSRH